MVGSRSYSLGEAFVLIRLGQFPSSSLRKKRDIAFLMDEAGAVLTYPYSLSNTYAIGINSPQIGKGNAAEAKLLEPKAHKKKIQRNTAAPRETIL